MPHVFFATEFGSCGIAWHDAELVGFQLPDDDLTTAIQHFSSRTHTQPATEEPPVWVQAIINRAQKHLTGHLQDFADVPLDWTRVTVFQQAVYRHTQTIKAGYKKSYGDIAHAIALGPEAARAVGVALATNPWPLIVPCHRIVSASGKMTGFSAPGGVRTKTRLLTLEGAELLSE